MSGAIYDIVKDKLAAVLDDEYPNLVRWILSRTDKRMRSVVDLGDIDPVDLVLEMIEAGTDGDLIEEIVLKIEDDLAIDRISDKIFKSKKMDLIDIVFLEWPKYYVMAAWRSAMLKGKIYLPDLVNKDITLRGKFYEPVDINLAAGIGLLEHGTVEAYKISVGSISMMFTLRYGGGGRYSPDMSAHAIMRMMSHALKNPSLAIFSHMFGRHGTLLNKYGMNGLPEYVNSGRSIDELIEIIGLYNYEEQLIYAYTNFEQPTGIKTIDMFDLVSDPYFDWFVINVLQYSPPHVVNHYLDTIYEFTPSDTFMIAAANGGYALVKLIERDMVENWDVSLNDSLVSLTAKGARNLYRHGGKVTKPIVVNSESTGLALVELGEGDLKIVSRAAQSEPVPFYFI